MQTTAHPKPMPMTKTISRPWLMLISRSMLFLLFQGLIALLLFTTGATFAWDESPRWWTLMVSLANFVSIYLLIRLYNAEDKRFFDTFKFSRTERKKDLLWFIVFSIFAMPIFGTPREPLAEAIFGDAMIATNIMFQSRTTLGVRVEFPLPAHHRLRRTADLLRIRHAAPLRTDQRLDHLAHRLLLPRRTTGQSDAKCRTATLLRWHT